MFFMLTNTKTTCSQTMLTNIMLTNIILTNIRLTNIMLTNITLTNMLTNSYVTSMWLKATCSWSTTVTLSDVYSQNKWMTMLLKALWCKITITAYEIENWNIYCVNFDMVVYVYLVQTSVLNLLTTTLVLGSRVVMSTIL